MPLIKSASVRKLYPNELVGDADRARSRTRSGSATAKCSSSPHDGTVIDLMQDERFARPAARRRRGRQPPHGRTTSRCSRRPARCESRIRAGTLVSARRWTLKIDNGIDVRLPERGAAEAVARLVRLEREQRILDKDVIAIDLRMPDRIVVRLTEEADGGAARKP